jgi:hypothetical protein
MTKTLALLLDSYRELNAKRLFWISLVISGFVVACFAAIGLQKDTITFLWWSTPLRANVLTLLDPASLYQSIFVVFGVGFWLTWVGNILALCSTAGIFPDFLAAGSIDLYLAKPISRLRLFISKYVGGLLFVTLQVAVFSFCTFLVLGLRGSQWNPTIFLAIPIVVLVFSYLFSICVLLGVLTRSTVTSLLVTLLLWFFLWGAQRVETVLLQESIRATVNAESLDRQIEQTRADIAKPEDPATSQPGPTTNSVVSSFNPLHFFVHRHDDLQARLDRLEAERRDVPTSIQSWHSAAYALITVLPKTSGTTEVLTRALTTDQAKQFADSFEEDRDNHPGPRRRDAPPERRAARKLMEEAENMRTAGWFIGTSVGFELVVVGLAAWIFCRRDY